MAKNCGSAKWLRSWACLAVLWATSVGVAQETQPQQEPAPALPAAPPAVDASKLPYVYTKWRHFTVKDGLPNDHIFAVKVHGSKVWIGTEDGLACYDKETGTMQSWKEKDGLPFQSVTALEVDTKTGDLWIGLFGGGLARFSGGRFDHFHQLNSGLVNDVVYGIAIENDNVWAATTAGASRYNMVSKKWTIFTEKNAPMEEIWNYGVCANDGKVWLAVWGSGVLEFDVATEKWNEYLDPDGEMEIDLYRDDGIVHVITTGVTYIDKILWVSTYFGMSRYDGRHWRGLYADETGLPSDFTNNVKARSGNECWFAHDKGLGVVADFPSDTVVAYTRDEKTLRGVAKIYRAGTLLKTLDMELGVPHNFAINIDHDGNDTWIATGHGLGWAIGDGYYAGLQEKPEWLAEAEAENAQKPATVLSADH
ncbi:MAG: ligand-binding sensor domain-containing protein [Pirellulaceae bacterium]